MKRALLAAVLLVAALVLQLTVVNRLPLPGAGTPDLVLLVVVTLGLCGSPAAGAVTGFWAGLGVDLAPPGSYLIGEYALAFCVVGYLCGRLRSVVDRSALLTVVLAMVCAAVGEALVALLGLMLSDPQVTWPAVRQVLPSAVAYDIVLIPFLLYAVMRAVRWADSLGGYRGVAEQPADGAALLARAQGGGALPRGSLPGGAGLGAIGLGGAVLGGAGLLGGAGWLAGPQGSRAPKGGGRKGVRTPRLREAASRPGDGWVGGGPRSGLLASQRPVPARPARPGRPPRLRPGSGSPGSAVARPPRTLPQSPVNLRMGAGRRKDGSIGRGLGSPAGAGCSAAGTRQVRAPGLGVPQPPPGCGPAGRPDPARRGIGRAPGSSLTRGCAAARPASGLSSGRRCGSDRRGDTAVCWAGACWGAAERAGGWAAAPWVSARAGAWRRGPSACG